MLSPQASSLQGAVDAFPMGWLNVLSQPQSFYNIQVEPIDVARTYGQPLLATLTIQNIGDLDLTLGEGGLLQRGIVFGAEIHGITDKHFASVAYDELAGPLVLPARQSMSQVIRLDQGALEQYLDDDPSVALQVYGSATSNPAQSPGGTLKPAAAGYTASFGKVFGRLAAPLGSDETAKALQQLVDGTSRQKLESLQLLGRIVQRSEADTGGGGHLSAGVPARGDPQGRGGPQPGRVGVGGVPWAAAVPGRPTCGRRWMRWSSPPTGGRGSWCWSR